MPENCNVKSPGSPAPAESMFQVYPIPKSPELEVLALIQVASKQGVY